MKILKFGGSSIGSVTRISQVLEIIIKTSKEADPFVVVFSAYEGVTDQLIKMGNLAANGDQVYQEIFIELEQKHIDTIKQLVSIKNQSTVLTHIKLQLNELEEVLHGVYLVKELTLKTLDYIMSFGERLSTFTMSECLRDKGINNRYIDSRKIFKTDDSFGRAKIDFKVTNKNITAQIDGSYKIYLVTGFIASTHNNETTTIGRGGSDYSASIIAATLNAREIEIWTDVNGVLTADPSKVKNAFSIDYLTYEEAMELSHFGAKVIYPPTMQPALNKKIPLRVKNTFNPDFKGTVISSKKGSNKYLIKGISSIDDIALIQIQGSGMIGVAGIAERIFNSLAKKKINIILISQASSEHSICMAIMPEHKDEAKKALKTELEYEIKIEAVSKISVESDLAIIAVVGENMRKRRGIAGRVFQSLGNNGINISAIAQGSSELNISMVIANKDEKKALNALHDSFFLSGIKTLNLYLLGTGLIGRTLLWQINKQKQVLCKEFQTSLKLIGIANSKKMIFAEQGIETPEWETILSKSTIKTDIDRFIRKMKAINLPNSIFIDCTMEDSIAEKYLEILESNISVVTPNKKANTKEYTYYSKLREYVTKYNVKFLYETNVGAALPIINTIKELVSSGDKVVRIEAILSGTLSYLFNSFTGEKPFSELVYEVLEKGFTEPDPREDLNGNDVARKLLILIREAGYQKELSEIQIENLIPVGLRKVSSTKEFLSAMKQYDPVFEERREKAAKNKKVLRYIAQFGPDEAQVGLKEVDITHPFYHISGSDNILSIYTRYYNESPLVIRGPGAGAEVTAAGVLADILKISRYSN